MSQPNRKLTSRELTEAVQGFARRHGYYARTVRTMTSLMLAAIAEWRQRQ
jgi:hypothetical protein